MAEKKRKTRLDPRKVAISVTIFLSLVTLLALCLTGWFIYSSLNEASGSGTPTQVKVQGVNVELLDSLEKRQHDRLQAPAGPTDLRNPFQPVPTTAPVVPPAAPAPNGTDTATSPAGAP